MTDDAVDSNAPRCEGRYQQVQTGNPCAESSSCCSILARLASEIQRKHLRRVTPPFEVSFPRGSNSPKVSSEIVCVGELNITNGFEGAQRLVGVWSLSTGIYGFARAAKCMFAQACVFGSECTCTCTSIQLHRNAALHRRSTAPQNCPASRWPASSGRH